MTGLSHMRTVAPLLNSLRRSVGVLASRPYGSAAAAYDYYSDEEEEYELQCCQPVPRIDSAGSAPRRGVQWVMIGEPGAKRHLYAERIAKLLEVPHISMGSLVRQEMDPRSELYKQIAKAVNEGKLVPESIVFAILSKRLDEGYNRGETGFILDGISRTRIQAELLDQIADIDLVVNFKCTEGKNNLGAGTLPPRQNLWRKNYSGSRLSLQSPEKLRIYTEQSKPLEDYYRTQKKLLDFQVTDAPSETWKGLLAALHLQHMHAVTTSQKLTV